MSPVCVCRFVLYIIIYTVYIFLTVFFGTKFDNSIALTNDVDDTNENENISYSLCANHTHPPPLECPSQLGVLILRQEFSGRMSNKY